MSFPKTSGIMASVVILASVTAMGLSESANIVGCENILLESGNNRIEVHFDATRPLFSTLDMILAFDPPWGIVGDELELILDGKIRRYLFDSFNGTNYVLKELGTMVSETYSLESFPWCEVLWISHKRDTPVALKCAGEIAGEYGRIGYECDSNDGGRSTPLFTLEIVDDTDAARVTPIKIEGGHLRYVGQ